MRRRPTDEDVVFLSAHVSRILAAVVEAHAQGYGSSKPASRTLADIILAVLKMPFTEASQQVDKDISEYYLVVYRHMIARGSPEGIENQWLATAELFRTIGDAKAEVAKHPVQIGDLDNREIFQFVQLGANEFREIANELDSDNASQALYAAAAVLNSLDQRSSDYPTSTDEHELLQLLVSGNTVDEIADELNVSTRTIHRRLQAVWDRIGASSRAEGIAIVSARGWLD